MTTEIYIAKNLEAGRDVVDLVACVKGTIIGWHHGLSDAPLKDAEKYASEVAHELRRRKVFSYKRLINGQYLVFATSEEKE